MNTDAVADDLRASLPTFPSATVEPAGGGDYCLAYTVDREWIFLVARHAEGARSLARAAALLPTLAPTLPLPIPDIAHAGQTKTGGHTFVGYRKVGGVELTTARFEALSPQAQERCAVEIAQFLHQIHRFPVEVAREKGIIEPAYPFAATEDGISEGTAEEQYGRDLDRLRRSGVLDRATEAYCRRIVDEHLRDRRNLDGPVALLHGEVSQDHLLYDPATARLTGVIDFNGMIIGDPVRDFLYLYEDYGLPFMAVFLAHYPVDVRRQVLARLHFFHEWLTALRLLWVVDHGYERRIAPRLQELHELREQAAAPPWQAIV